MAHFTILALACAPLAFAATIELEWVAHQTEQSFSANAGDVIKFVGGKNNVNIFASKEAFESCNFVSSIAIKPDKVDRLRYFQVPADAVQGMEYYFGDNKINHCSLEGIKSMLTIGSFSPSDNSPPDIDIDWSVAPFRKVSKDVPWLVQRGQTLWFNFPDADENANDPSLRDARLMPSEESWVNCDTELAANNKLNGLDPANKGFPPLVYKVPSDAIIGSSIYIADGKGVPSPPGLMHCEQGLKLWLMVVE